MNIHYQEEFMNVEEVENFTSSKSQDVNINDYGEKVLNRKKLTYPYPFKTDTHAVTPISNDINQTRMS